jgi:hypothetical protein
MPAAEYTALGFGIHEGAAGALPGRGGRRARGLVRPLSFPTLPRRTVGDLADGGEGSGGEFGRARCPAMAPLLCRASPALCRPSALPAARRRPPAAPEDGPRRDAWLLPVSPGRRGEQEGRPSTSAAQAVVSARQRSGVSTLVSVSKRASAQGSGPCGVASSQRWKWPTKLTRHGDAVQSRRRPRLPPARGLRLAPRQRGRAQPAGAAEAAQPVGAVRRARQRLAMVRRRAAAVPGGRRGGPAERGRAPAATSPTPPTATAASASGWRRAADGPGRRRAGGYSARRLCRRRGPASLRCACGAGSGTGLPGLGLDRPDAPAVDVTEARDPGPRKTRSNLVVGPERIE